MNHAEDANRRTKTSKSRTRLTPEQIAARDGHQRAELQLARHATTVPTGAGHETPTGTSPSHPPARTGTDTNRSNPSTDRSTTPDGPLTVGDSLAVGFTGAGQGAAQGAAQGHMPCGTGSTFVIVTDDGTIDAETRHAALANMRPEGPTQDVAAVKRDVIALIEAVPYKGYESDRALMTIGVAFARWCLHNSADGQFVPERDLNEDAFEDFLTSEKAGVTAQTRGTYSSQLRRIARQGRTRRRGLRRAAAAPYTNKVRDRLWQEACDMGYWGANEMRTVLALTFGAGCRGVEVHNAKAGQVDRTAGRVVLAVVSDGMWVREVPVYGQYGRWLDQRSRELGPDEWLFRPTVTARRNATSDLVARMRKRNDAFTGFKSTRARHTWLVTCLQAGIPYNAVCQAAGLSRDSNLPADLLPHMPQLSFVETRRLFEASFARTTVRAVVTP